MSTRRRKGEASLTRIEEVSGRPQALHVHRFRVRVLKGPDKGKQAELNDDRVRIGRGEPNDLPLDDDLASRLHAEISVRAEGFRLLDLGSRNGTFLGDHRVIDAYLKGGERIRIGDDLIAFEPMDGTVSLPLSSGTGFGRMQAESVAMRRVLEVFERAAPTEATILIHGETGTGKEEAARAIHQSSGRSGGPFVVLDCSSVQATLLGSELFGHERGAFTGAVGERRGAFERAHGGTLFLDELGELGLDLQPQLLRVLERREVQRLGGEEVAPVDVRVIAATNRDLRQDVNSGRFRSDLYFRLAVVQVTLPPLRERLEDLPILTSRLLAEIGEKNGLKPAMPSPADIEQLSKHYWPGNVRELRNALERSVLLGAGLDISEVALPTAAAAPAPNPPRSTPITHLPYREAKALVVERFEKEYVEELMRSSEGNISRAARDAKMDRSYLLELLKKHGVLDRA